MRALGELCDGVEQLSDLRAVVRMAKDRSAKVASVMKTSQGTGSKVWQVGLRRRL